MPEIVFPLNLPNAQGIRYSRPWLLASDENCTNLGFDILVQKKILGFFQEIFQPASQPGAQIQKKFI